MKEINHQKKNGVYYTPSELADFLVEPLISKKIRTIFDPSCGRGALCHAAYRKMSALKVEADYYGCDIERCLKKTKKPKIKFTHKDFLEYLPKKRFDLILANPPYIRYHRLSADQRQRYIDYIRSSLGITIKSKPDLWIFFLLKSLLHLNIGGGIGMILPKSFLQADYACGVRSYIRKKFKDIKILNLSKDYFVNTHERVVLLWLQGYGYDNKCLEVAYSNGISDRIVFKPIIPETWDNENISCEIDLAKEILGRYVEGYGFAQFGDYGKPLIGVVTGANKYFLKQADEAFDLGFSSKDIVPILNTCRELNSFHLNGYVPPNNLWGDCICMFKAFCELWSTVMWGQQYVGPLKKNKACHYNGSVRKAVMFGDQYIR